METLFKGQTNKRILYSPTTFAKRNLLYLQETGELKSARPHTSQRESLSSFLFMMVKKGSGTVQYNGNEYGIEEGYCFFVDCMKQYAHRCNDWEIIWVHFNGIGMAGIYEKFHERTNGPVFQAKNKDAISQVLEQLYAIALTDDPIRDMRINENLSTLLVEIMAQSLMPVSERRKQSDIARIKDYLDANYNQPIILDDLSVIFGMNKFIMEKEFKREYGLAIIEYLLKKRITKAKELLRFFDYTIERIGREVGIGEPYYFSRLFKKIEGISPREFRKKWS